MKTKILLTLDEVEIRNLKALCLKFGGSYQVQIRRLIQNAIDREIGSYRAKGQQKIKSSINKVEQEEKEKITVEQYCELKGGKVKKNGSGLLVCAFQVTPPTRFSPEGNWNSVPLTKKDIDNYLK